MAEQDLVVLQGEGVVHAPVHGEAAVEDAAVEEDVKRHPEGKQGDDAVFQRGRQFLHFAAVGFAGDGDVGAVANPQILRDEDAEREEEQERAEGTGRGVIELRTGDVEVNLGGDDVEAAAQNQRVTEVGERLHEHQQEGVGERRAQQREDNLEEGLEAAGAQRIRGFFNRGVNGFQRAVQNHEGERGEGENLRDGDAVEAVEPVAVGDAEPFGEIAGTAEHQRYPEADDKRRRHNRQNGKNLADKGGAARDAGGVKGEGEAENGGHQANEAGEHQRVADNAQNVTLAEDAQDLLRMKNAVLIKHRNKNRAGREDDKERNQEDDDEQRGDDELVAL